MEIGIFIASRIGETNKMKVYDIFDIGKIEFDENRPVYELVEEAFERYGYWEPAGMDIVTVYDVQSYCVVLDRNMTCSEAGLGNLLCVAYYEPNKFYYVEGGWGHHMIQMNVAKLIDEPVSFQLIFEGFNGWPVISGRVRLLEMFNFLKKTEYIDTDNYCLTVYDYDEYYSERRINGTAKKRKLNVKDVLVGKLNLMTLELSDKVCVVS